MPDPHLHVSFRPDPATQGLLERLPARVTWPEDTGGQPRESLLAAVAGARAVLTLLTDTVDEQLLVAAGPQLELVANMAVGHDNIDLEACARRGVRVSNTPGVLDDATADLAFALVLAASRRMVEADRFVRSGEPWTWRPDLFVGLDVSGGATLGIVGLGRIGLAVARRALAFDMTVIGTPTRSGAAEADRLGIEQVPLPDLLRRSDVVSLHCPLTAETRHLIDREALAAMPEHAVLVNTARGPVVDEAALAEALANGTIAAAGLDVHEHEPAVNPALLTLPNVITLPHIGSAARRTRERMAAVAVDNVRAALDGRPLPNPVTRP